MRRNPDENQRELEREYGITGDVETLNKINIIRNRTNQPLLLSRQQALEMTWREVDSDIFQFINQVWHAYGIPDAIYRNLVREDNLDPDAEYEEGTGEYAVRQQIDEDLRENVTDKWRELTIKRSRAYDNYLNYLMGRKLQDPRPFEE